MSNSNRNMRIPVDMGPFLRMDGGYTHTYISISHKRVFRYCDKYYMRNRNNNNKDKHDKHENQYIQYSTVSDLALTKAFEQLKGFPTVYHFIQDDQQIRIEMDYLGKTLVDSVHTKSIYTRLQLLPQLLNELTHQCINLLYNGVQHTDIKPSNILIDHNNHFHLIDFNCMSIAHPGYGVSNKSPLNVTRCWHSSVGTWSYIAPEILWNGIPHDTSMVWSIGMVAIYWVIGSYPISSERMKRYGSTQVISRDDWKKLLTAIRRKYHNYLRIEAKYQKELHGWYEKISQLLHWNPHKRPTLEQLPHIFHLPIHNHKIYVKPIKYISDPTLITPYIRERVIDKGISFLKMIHREQFIVASIMLFDRIYPNLMAKYKDYSLSLPSQESIFIACCVIYGFMTNNYVFDDDSIVLTLYQVYHIQCDELFKLIFVICDICQFEIWQREWFWYVHDEMDGKKWNIEWDIVKDILISLDEPYDPALFAKKYMKKCNI